MFCSVTIKILGIDEIEKKVAPIFTITASVKIYGVGSMLKIREIVIVSGIRIITAKILLINAEKNMAREHNIDIRATGFPLDNFIARTPKNWNTPTSSEI